jgi:hypothetical protein
VATFYLADHEWVIQKFARAATHQGMFGDGPNDPLGEWDFRANRNNKEEPSVWRQEGNRWTPDTTEAFKASKSSLQWTIMPRE